MTSRAVTINWDPPPSDGSCDVAQYYIDIREENSSDYTPAGRVDGRINSFTADFLNKGFLYNFRVKAKNSAGFGEPPAELREPVELLQLAGWLLTGYIFCFIIINIFFLCNGIVLQVMMFDDALIS